MIPDIPLSNLFAAHTGQLVVPVVLPLLAAFLMQPLARVSAALARGLGPLVLILSAWIIAQLWIQLGDAPFTLAIGGFAPPLGILFYADGVALLFALAVPVFALLFWPGSESARIGSGIGSGRTSRCTGAPAGGGDDRTRPVRRSLQHLCLLRAGGRGFIRSGRAVRHRACAGRDLPLSDDQCLRVGACPGGDRDPLHADGHPEPGPDRTACARDLEQPASVWRRSRSC
jgi:hypothetical protein